MMNRFALILLMGAVALCAGCDEKAVLKKAATVVRAEDDFARTYLSTLREGDVLKAESLHVAEAKTPEIRTQLEEAAEGLKKDPRSVELVGFNVKTSADQKLTMLNYQVELPDSWLLISVDVKVVGDEKGILGLGIHPMVDPQVQRAANAFKLSGKSAMHFIILALAVAVPLFILYAVILCARSKTRRKGLWIAFILLGIGTLVMNWTTGEIMFQPTVFQLFGVDFSRKYYGPCLISVSFPLGAILFLLKRKKLSRDETNR